MKELVFKDLDAAADALAKLASGTQEERREAVDFILELSRSDGAAERNAIVKIGVAAASDPRDSTRITTVLREAAQDLEALENIELPHEVITGETEPTEGKSGWQSTASSMGVIRILTRFSKAEPAARIDVKEVHDLPASVPALPEDLVVNSIFLLAPEGFHTRNVVANHIRFSVEKDWLEDHNLHPWSVQFIRFDEERALWDPFLGKPVGEDEDRIYYAVSPQAMSLWAITGMGEVPPTHFRIDSLAITPTHADAGRDFQVQAQVTNLTSGTGVWNGVLWLNDQAHESRSVDIGTGAPKIVTFSLRLDPGTYEVRIGKLVRHLTVETPPIQPLTSTTPPEPTPTPKPTPTKVIVLAQSPTKTPVPVQMPTPVPVKSPTKTPEPARTPTPVPIWLADPTPVSQTARPPGGPTQESLLSAGTTVGIGFGITAVVASICIYLWRARRSSRNR
jgi:PGF-pre-PGF domain-containing protein